ncbi:MAG: Ribosomal large subunit pseudouridine synthase D [Chlamydiae bacterium]|nr:Ribosomal large subunit pseudouridine synthase D [Chlamydiota bacterium]
MEIDTDVIIVTASEAGERLDKILAARYENRHSRTYFQYLIEEHLVSLNGAPVKKRIKPIEGDEIEVHFVLTPQTEVQPEPIPLDILYEDDDILVVNKPAGMVVHPAPGNWTGTFVNALLHHCQDLAADPNDVRPGIVHRLDKETSGVLIAAKNLLAQQKLIEQFANRKVKKQYTAICVGNPGKGEISAPIGRHPVHRKKMTVIEGGKPAVSHYETLAYDERLSLVSIKPITGRTHQIRVHMKHLGHPILGDPVYGNPSFNKKMGIQRQLLHAEKLSLIHPVSGKDLTFNAPMPQDMNYL